MIVRGDSVVLPFASAEDAASIVRWLDSGSGSFTWAFLRTHVSMGLFKVDMITNFSYVCSFQKRLNGQGATEDDPMTRQMGVNVNLDYKYGLLLTEGALMNCRGWLGVDVQCCIVPLLQSSPLKRSHVVWKRSSESSLFRMMRTPRRLTIARCMGSASWIQRGIAYM